MKVIKVIVTVLRQAHAARRISHVRNIFDRLAFDRKGLTRRERAHRVRGKPGYFEKYGKSARKVLDVALTRFSANGYMTLDDVLDRSRLVYFLRFLPHNTLGKPAKLVRAFGGKVRYDEAMRKLQDLLDQD